MWKPRSVNSADPDVGSVGAAVLWTVSAQYLSLGHIQSELSSEILCWIMLSFLFNVGYSGDIRRFDSAPGSQCEPALSGSLWMVAISIALSSTYKAETTVIRFLPALTPLLLVAERCLWPSRQTSKITDSRVFSPLARTIWGSTLAALFAVLVLSNWKLDILGLALSILPVAALLVVYVILTPRRAGASCIPDSFDLKEAITPLSLRVVGILVVVVAMKAVLLGSSSIQILPTVLLGVSKALSWLFTLRAVFSFSPYQGTSKMLADYPASWLIATAIGTFGIISTRNPFTQTSEFQALSNVLGSILALCQIIHMLPRQARARSTLWCIALVPLVPYLANVYAIVQSSMVSTFEHPVEVLIRNADADFMGMLQGQSRNYTAACKEYQRRYNKEPPPGFDDWYEFAVRHQSPIIDEFDTIFDSISPFWALSGNEVIRAMNGVQNAPSSDVWHCSFSEAKAETHCKHPHRSNDRHIEFSFNKLLGDLSGKIRSVNFLVNHLDEPRVVISPQPHQLPGGGVSHITSHPRITDMSKLPSWEAITRICESRQNDTNSKPEHLVETFALPFVANLSSTMNLCYHPEYSTLHGFFMSPVSFYPVEGLVPILSTGTLSTMGDILFPSPAYMEPEFQYEEAKDMKWEKKKNNLYWAGSTTGAFALDSQWRVYHRQRFVKLTQNLERGQHYYLRERRGVIGRMKSSFLNSRLYDVAFTRIFQCERRACRDQQIYFNVKSWAGKDEALRSRLVFDIDGNGISGRYYKLLASNSVPLKQTLLREWHDDRLMPWIHYIPVSPSMEELPELVFYLTSTEAGQRRAKYIAEQSRRWFSKAFREIDMSIYIYRLLLELGRLQD